MKGENTATKQNIANNQKKQTLLENGEDINVEILSRNNYAGNNREMGNVTQKPYIKSSEKHVGVSK